MIKEKTFEEVPVKQLNILAKNNITTYEDLLNFLPRAYKDFRLEYRKPCSDAIGKLVCITASVISVSEKWNTRKITKIRLKADDVIFYTYIFGKYNPYSSIITEARRYDKKIAVWGTLLYSEDFGYSIMQPDFICEEARKREFLKIVPIYKKFRGITNETMLGLVKTALKTCEIKELDKKKLEEAGFTLPETKESYENLHHPEDLNLTPYEKRIRFNKLYDFASRMAERNSKEAKGTTVILNKFDVVKDIVKNLPYELTEDQRKHLNHITEEIKSGRRADALLQGDVGCGKTMVAILLLFEMAENGYQGVIMAPTSILAKQHYSQIKELGDKYHITTAYLDGSTKAAEKKSIYKGLASGEIKIVVGTHSLTNSGIQYGNLGIVIIDEEHRFGVEQRNALLSHAEKGVNTVVMSATPMPRTIAGVLHGNNTEILDIHTMPANRLPIKTAVCNSDESVMDFIEKQIADGRQAYIICPLIEGAAEEEESPVLDIRSLNETVLLYQRRFEPFYHVKGLNGQMSAQEMEDTINDFAENKIQILISTTVVEVGVNVPNATVMVISNAERFGLAAMHQLRGRVGRGKYQSYCILQSKDTANQRLKAMVEYRDGFEIAKIDLELRGAGDLIGVKQSGFTDIMNYICEDPLFYKKIQDMVEKERTRGIF